MKFYKPEQLREGMRLAKPIYNRQGVLLYERGDILTQNMISNILHFGLLGVLILDPDETLTPVSATEQKIEMLQTSCMFRLRDCLIAISKGHKPQDLHPLVEHICSQICSIRGRLSFSQTLRSSEDYNYKHAVCTAMLCAMIARNLDYPTESMHDLVTAALLSDFGYLYVPKNILEKKESSFTRIDLVTMDQYREKALHLLQQQSNPYALGEDTFTILNQYLEVQRKENPHLNTSMWLLSTRILMVADKYDRMTAMSLNHSPKSSLAALRHLRAMDGIYDSIVVDALSDSLVILSVGQSVTLSNQSLATILSINEEDPLYPQVLDASNNKVYDLGSPKLRDIIEITDIATTVDRRYVCDEQTLKHFVPDSRLQATTRRIRMRLEKAKKRELARKRGRA